MKQHADFFEGLDAQLVFIARRLKDAMKLETVLTGAGIDYVVEADEYTAGFIFKSVRVGAFFYVAPEAREQAVAAMLENGFVPAK